MKFDSLKATDCCEIGVVSGLCLSSSPLDARQTSWQRRFSDSLNVQAQWSLAREVRTTPIRQKVRPPLKIAHATGTQIPWKSQ